MYVYNMFIAVRYNRIWFGVHWMKMIKWQHKLASITKIYTISVILIVCLLSHTLGDKIRERYMDCHIDGPQYIFCTCNAFM